MPTVLQILGLVLIAVCVGAKFGWPVGGMTAGVEAFSVGLALEAIKGKPGDG